MKFETKQPRLPLFAIFPIWMGNDWRWLERIDLVYGLTMGVPMFSLRLPPMKVKHVPYTDGESLVV